VNKYEAMFIVKPDLSEDKKKALFDQINEAVTKNNGSLASASAWAEKKKLYFPIKKYREGTYYLINFNAPPEAIKDMRHTYNLNENILRVLITRVE